MSKSFFSKNFNSGSNELLVCFKVLITFTNSFRFRVYDTQDIRWNNKANLNNTSCGYIYFFQKFFTLLLFHDKILFEKKMSHYWNIKKRTDVKNVTISRTFLNEFIHIFSCLFTKKIVFCVVMSVGPISVLCWKYANDLFFEF